MAPIQAAVLPGTNHPDLVTAIEIWLNDDDRHSLPTLANLAGDGNTAARLLLARIESTDRASTDFVSNLSRKERMKLYRAPVTGSRFQPSWIRIEAEKGIELAELLLEAAALGINLEAVENLYASGEPEASEHLIRKIAVDGSQSQRESLTRLLPLDAELSPYLRGFQFSHSGQTTGRTGLRFIIASNRDMHPSSIQLSDTADARVAMQFVDFGYQSGKDTIGSWSGGEYYDAIAEWVLRAPTAAALARLCKRDCAESELAACAVTGLGLIGGYYEIIRFDSPLENLIPQETFIASARALGMTARRIAAARTEAGETVFTRSELTGKSACLARAIEP